jgi:hypothetical protein
MFKDVLVFGHNFYFFFEMGSWKCFTLQEDMMILSHVYQHGYTWTALSKILVHNASSIRGRYHRLMKNEKIRMLEPEDVIPYLIEFFPLFE